LQSASGLFRGGRNEAINEGHRFPVQQSALRLIALVFWGNEGLTAAWLHTQPVTAERPEAVAVELDNHLRNQVLAFQPRLRMKQIQEREQ
jgi:hypothetical protein